MLQINPAEPPSRSGVHRDQRGNRSLPSVSSLSHGDVERAIIYRVDSALKIQSTQGPRYIVKSRLETIYITVERCINGTDDLSLPGCPTRIVVVTPKSSVVCEVGNSHAIGNVKMNVLRQRRS